MWLDQGLTPLRAFVSEVVPEIQHEADLREAYVKDYDSYRRRFNSLQDKQAKYAAAPPSANGGPNPRLAEVEKALYQIQSKLHAAEDRYRRQNSKIKEEMIKAKLMRDELLENAMRAAIVSQVELFTRTGEHLAQLLGALPEEEKVISLQKQIKALVAEGGPEARPVEMSQMGKMVKAVTNNFTPRTPPSPTTSADGAPFKSTPPGPSVVDQYNMAAGGQDGNNGGGNGATSPPKSSEKPETSNSMVLSQRDGGDGGEVGGVNVTTASRSSSSGGGGNVFTNFFNRQSVGGVEANKGGNLTAAAGNQGVADGYETMDSSSGAPKFDETVPLEVAAVAAVDASPTPPVMARALYDNEPEDETELGFVVGDLLEILTKDDSGWWEARLNGKVGSIPANYVELLV